MWNLYAPSFVFKELQAPPSELPKKVADTPLCLDSIYCSPSDEPCLKLHLQKRRRTAEAESGLQNPQILWDQFTSPSSTLQSFPPPAKRHAATHISPQPAFSHTPPEPSVFAVYQEEPTIPCGVCAAQAARPQMQDETLYTAHPLLGQGLRFPSELQPIGHATQLCVLPQAKDQGPGSQSLEHAAQVCAFPSWLCTEACEAYEAPPRLDDRVGSLVHASNWRCLFVLPVSSCGHPLHYKRMLIHFGIRVLPKLIRTFLNSQKSYNNVNYTYCLGTPLFSPHSCSSMEEAAFRPKPLNNFKLHQPSGRRVRKLENEHATSSHAYKAGTPLFSPHGCAKSLSTTSSHSFQPFLHLSEEWLKLYKVKYWYPGSAPILRGARDHILPHSRW